MRGARAEYAKSAPAGRRLSRREAAIDDFKDSTEYRFLGDAMYSESDIASAVQAGAISAEAAEAFRSHVASLHAMPAADEEHFRLITGFNDIFVSIACLLVIFAAAAVGSSSGEGWLGGILVATATWLMAEIFTRRRRMALPSIILLLAFVLGLGLAVWNGLEQAFPTHRVWHEVPVGITTPPVGDYPERWSEEQRYPWQIAVMVLGAAAAAGCGAVIHWFRFRVAITVAAAAGALVLLFMAAVAAIRNEPIGENPFIAPAALLCGFGVFAYAMRWDLSDRLRTSQRADIAFWLHLVAAPLIAHPLFYWMGVMGSGSIAVGTAVGVLVIYLVFALVALAIDRRALLVSALAYVLIALAQLFRIYGSIHLNIAMTALLIGSALLALSAWWPAIRRTVVNRLPEGARTRLPPISQSMPGIAN